MTTFLLKLLQIQEEVAQTLKAEANRVRPLNLTSTARPTTIVSINNSTEDSAIKKLLEDENAPYEDDVSEDEEDESEDDYDDDDEDDENEEDPEDDEQLMTQCPDYCRCAGEYAAVTTAT